MDLFSDVNFAGPASRPTSPHYDGVIPPDASMSPFTSRSTSPASSCHSPSSSVSSASPTMSVAELADQLGRSSFHSARIPNPSAAGSRRPHATERWRSDRLAPGYQDSVRQRRQAYGRLQHDTRRLVNIGSLVEQLMQAEHIPSASSTHSSSCSSAACADSASNSAASATGLDFDIPISPSAENCGDVDPFKMIGDVRGWLRASGITKASRRRPNAVQKEVRMRKKPKFRPR